MIRKYYFPWFFSSCKKICKYIGKYFQKNISNNTSKSGSNERKIFDFYKNMNLKDNRTHVVFLALFESTRAELAEKQSKT